ncbi:NUDIX domain-containing protein [Aeromicrobium fastidiosum]|uniref:NUDIX hydrolase n=1 Tax=Aeromicrobium fastidiosum TaxID=52699 RepID=UPI0020237B27|nr:NUDIX domain-containing protein [Aeromicrobium fastidiosum]MCL8251893.1 NUDIX domain-containing protein [Aeromicrobium fastidiosum]
MTDATRTQRLGAYAVVIVGERILLTRISPVGYPAGSWTLPGGGVDHGESPHDAVVRELHEETGLQAFSSRLVDVHDVHVVAEGRDDRWEDYHGVHLLYAVEVDPTVEPHVVDVGGTTDVARWVAVADVGAAVSPVLPMVEHALAHADQFVAGV